MHNVGSIFRTSDAVRLEKLLLTGFTALPPRPEINKSALGATESVPWEHVKNPLDKIKELKSAGYTVYSLEQTTESKIYTQVNYQFPLCLIVGNEVNGVSEELLSLADYSIEIPMLGIKHSLNVSVAFGVVAYDMLAKCM
jgi:tRNA G18 (ribose-2'-O)-methylase SpoU